MGSFVQAYFIFRSYTQLQQVEKVQFDCLGPVDCVSAALGMHCDQGPGKCKRSPDGTSSTGNWSSLTGGQCRLAEGAQYGPSADYDKWHKSCHETIDHFDWWTLALPVLSWLTTIMFNVRDSACISRSLYAWLTRTVSQGWAWKLILFKEDLYESDFNRWHNYDVLSEWMWALLCVW